MGPILMIDKSALQSLKNEEISFLRKHYSVVLPPVLLIEVIADYAKYKNDGEAKVRVGSLSSKLNCGNNVNTDYRHLAVGELIGRYFPMDGRPILEATGIGYTANGEKSAIVEDSPWQIAARHWQEGRFTEEDIKFAYNYRTERDAVSIVELANELAKGAYLPKFKSLDEVIKFVLKAFCDSESDSEFQGQALRAWLIFLEVAESFSERVIKRWEAAGKPAFRKFSPYSFFCYSVMSVVAVAMTQNHVPTGKKSHLLVDVEYIFYLPFCQVFCSSDKFHRGLSPAFMRSNQVFVEGEYLKEDLHNIFEHWECLNDDQKCDHAKMNRPPRIEESITYQIWEKFMKSSYPQADVNLSNEQKTALLDKIKGAISAAEQNKKTIDGPDYRLYTKDNGQET